MAKLTSLCVYCGSRAGSEPAYTEAAQTLGRELAQRHITLVYGAGSTGLMGVLADACRGAGGKVIGVVPSFLIDWEVAHENLSERIVVPNMHTRKSRMFELSDAFCALPGGIGTLEEAFEMATWKQLRRHRRPLVVANVAGYWDPLLTVIEQTIRKGFAEESTRTLWHIVDDVSQVIPSAEALLGEAVQP